MLGRLIEIAQEGRHLAVERGLLRILDGETECGRVPLDSVEAVILSARQISLTRPVMVALAQHNALVVVCDERYMPISILAPYADNFESGHRMRAQAGASLPLKKQLWRAFVSEKLRNQAAVLEYHRPDSPMVNKLRLLAKATRSGDPNNTEGQGARLYWRALLGAGFVRDPERSDCNMLLNYAYTVLRSSVARSLVGAGLHPAFGVYHKQRLNPFTLADDAMEPFRPLADHIVFKIVQRAPGAILEPMVKKQLAALLQCQVRHMETTIPLYQALHHMARSMARTYVEGKVCVEIPTLLLEDTT